MKEKGDFSVDLRLIWIATLAILIGQLTGLAGRKPTLWLIEDAHWIDPTTLELIDLALDRIQTARVFVLITARPTFIASFGSHPVVTRLTLNRLGRAAGRSYAASVERVCAVIQKPRTFYVPGVSPTATGLGSPAFSLNGNIIGVLVLRTVNSSGGESSREGLSASIILPAADVLKGVTQALEAKGEEKKDATNDSKSPPPEKK